MDTVEVRRLKATLLLSSLVTLVLLGLAAFEENLFGEWREHQETYRSALIAKAPNDTARKVAAATRTGLRQVFLPKLNRVDRCTTCHLAVEDPRFQDAEAPLQTHSGGILASHSVQRYGCTICHDGQGRAVDRDDAHGDVAFWEAPLLRGAQVYRSCGRCHGEGDLFGSETDRFARGAPAPLRAAELEAGLQGAEAQSAGKRLILDKGCLGCHRYRGRGGALGPDLTYEGDKGRHGFDFQHVEGEHTVERWQRQHLRAPQKISPGSLMPAVDLPETGIEALAEAVLSLRQKQQPADYTPPPPGRGAVVPVSGEQLYRTFCSSCHGHDGQGSTVRLGETEDPRVDTPAALMVPSLKNADTLAVASDDYLRELIAHGRPGTTMPAWGKPAPVGGGLQVAEIDRIVAYLRGTQPPAPPIETISAAAGEVEAGRALFDGNCAGCHGFGGEGGVGISLRSPTWLAVASDTFIARTIVEGRPNTAMPSFRQFEGRQVSDLLAYLRTFQPVRSERAATLAFVRGPDDDQTASLAIGRILYEARCEACHGLGGEGGLAPTLSSPDFLAVADDDYLYSALTEGRPGTAMPAWRHLSSADVASIIKLLRSWQKTPSRALPTRPARGDWDVGRVLFKGLCAGCHGGHAEGGVGPQLANPVFLRSASDAMLREWISYGRARTAMPAFLRGRHGVAEISPQRIEDIVSYLRSLEHKPQLAIARTPNGRPQLGKEVYAGACASCHGPKGEGASGPALSNPAFLGQASDGYILATAILGRDGTEMRSFAPGPSAVAPLPLDDLNNVVAFIRSWEASPPFEGIPHRVSARGDVESGRVLYGGQCAGCHGPAGHGYDGAGGGGTWAPALHNPVFLRAATDGFLAATIARGRAGTAMRPFGRGAQGVAELSSEDIEDIVAFVRSWAKDGE